MLEPTSVDSINSAIESVFQDIQHKLSNYSYLLDFVVGLQIKDLQELQELKDAISQASQESLIILNILIYRSDSDWFLSDIYNQFGNTLPIRKAINCLKNKLGLFILDIISKHSIPDYRYQISQLIIAFEADLPTEIQQRLNLVADINSSAKVVYDHSFWFLCEESEGKLKKALRENKSILVDGHFLIKFEGYLSALCLNSFKSSSGDYFIKGVWYIPSDKSTKNAIRMAFDADLDQVSVPQGTWEAIRALQYDYNGDKLQTSSDSETLLQDFIQENNRRMKRRKQVQSSIRLQTNKRYRIIQRRNTKELLFQHRTTHSS